MLKNVNITVFVLGIGTTLSACVLISIAIYFNSEKLFAVADYIPYFSGIIIFIYYIFFASLQLPPLLQSNLGHNLELQNYRRF